MGKFLAGLIVVSAVLAGGALYYLQVYGYYRTISATGSDVYLTAQVSGTPELIAQDGFEAIDSDSSPIRYRACFQTPLTLDMIFAKYVAYPDAEPRNAPGWFDCFDAKTIGNDLQEGRAQAFMVQENLQYGIDRVAAIYPDGRGFVWHQINHCGEVVFDGQPAPEGCPPAPPV